MTKKQLKVVFWGILVFGFAIRIIPTRDNNFYFTMDIANEATKAREIIYGRLHPLVGQETSIEGLYHGPLWLYYISIGYRIFNFHPFGSLFMLFMLNLTGTAFLMWQVAKKVSVKIALFLGISLQFSWPYYDTTRFAFSPFPLVTVAIFDIIFLTEALDGNVQALILAAVTSSLPSHLEVASLPPFIALYFAVSLWAVFKRKLSLKHFSYGVITLILVHISRIISELFSDFEQLHAIEKHAAAAGSFVSSTQFEKFSLKQLTIIQEGLIPQSLLLSIILVIISFFICLKITKSAFIRKFYFLTLLLTLFTFVWFGSNTGWHPWHTIYIPPLFFISVILVISSLRKKYALPVITILIGAQLLVFIKNYTYNLQPTDDASLLVNELKAIDWTYQKSQGEGFFVYSYIPSVYDYHYQYLYWYQARQKYGYVPCEYTTFPKTPDFFIKNYQLYQQPQKPCGNFRFIIAESDQNAFRRQNWLDQVRKNTTLIEETDIGKIHLEKRNLNP